MVTPQRASWSGSRRSGSGMSDNETENYLSYKKESVKRYDHYVLWICLELDHKSVKDEEVMRWLELPCLVLYWTLAQILPISKMERCLCLGKVSLNGNLAVPVIPQEVIHLAREEGSSLILGHEDNDHALDGTYPYRISY